MTQQVNDSNFDEVVLKSDKPVIVDFWAEWCGPCRMIAPYIEQLADAYRERALVVKCDIESSPGIARRFTIRNIPTVLYFKNGEVVDKQVGAAARSAFEAKLTPLL
ncbi:MAG TPA: thioredoxin [Bacteroidales bacterium]|jgi:thioredoxin 1|nr:thioredoxin [Bacteroidales bacterium]OPZ57433.1 MAG: Thioredoxin-1 [Bacteroidetes bacterium ADurb.BinA012]MZQ78517.1 thioredoxin [Bacteroidales bacterium]HNV65975.1 thioredoxin [Bacteroidales bacterium]HNY57945.1 thioredoxin [Bacteroidales bacterium]